MAQFVQTHRGGKAMLYEGYKYLKIRDGKENTFWRCERHRSQCPARATTFEGAVQSTRGEHNHPPDRAANQVQATISKMRQILSWSSYLMEQHSLQGRSDTSKEIKEYLNCLRDLRKVNAALQNTWLL